MLSMYKDIEMSLEPHNVKTSGGTNKKCLIFIKFSTGGMPIAKGCSMYICLLYK